MKYLLIFAYSLLFIPVFGLLMLDPSVKNTTTIFVALIYTFISVFYVISAFKDLRFVKQIVLFFPTIYLIIAAFLKADSWYFFINPIVAGNIILYLSFFFQQYHNKLRLYFFFLALSFTYAFLIYDYWNKTTYEVQDVESIISERYLDENINIFDFEFINKNNETTKIKPNKYILIETWNENCSPCIESIRDLEIIIDSYKFNIAHYYLYEPNHKLSTKLIYKIFNFKNISSKNKILIDYDRKFFIKSGMRSYPVFLLFAQDGKLIDYFSGYSSTEKTIFISRLKKLLANSQPTNSSMVK